MPRIPNNLRERVIGMLDACMSTLQGMLGVLDERYEIFAYTLVGYGDAGILFFFRMNQDVLYNVVMAGCACTVGEINAMLTVLFLNEIVPWGWGFCYGLGSRYHSPLVVIDGNLNTQRYRDDILAHHVISLLISRFFSMIMPPVIQLETMYIFLGQITLISLMTGPLTVLFSTPSSMSGIVD